MIYFRKSQGGQTMFARIIILLILAVVSCRDPLFAAQKPDDHDALAGLKKAGVIFDVRVPDHEKLVFNLKLIKETFEGMVAQGVKPKMVVSFRGPGVKLLTAAEIDEEALELIRELKKKGVRIEVCSVALRVFKVEQAAIIPEVRLVANVFNSLIGYQNKGYALIAIN